MINQNEIEEAARFFPNKQRAREDYLEQSCEDFNSGDKPIDAVAFIMGHCIGQQFMSEELKKLEDRIEKLREAIYMRGVDLRNANDVYVRLTEALALDDQLKEGK